MVVSAGAQVEGMATLCTLPLDVINLVMRKLDAVDLAKLTLQNRCLRWAAGEPSLWEPLCTARWPACSTTAAYEGSWKQMYNKRAGMPPAFLAAVDRIHALQHIACTKTLDVPSSTAFVLFQTTMAALDQAGMASHRMRKDVRQSVEQKQLVACMTWWLQFEPGLAIRFIRRTNEDLSFLVETQTLDMLNSNALKDLYGRYSAIAYLGDVLQQCPAVHSSVREAVVWETLKLERTIHNVQLPPTTIDYAFNYSQVCT